jgi:hypothetical protein
MDNSVLIFFFQKAKGKQTELVQLCTNGTKRFSLKTIQLLRQLVSSNQIKMFLKHQGTRLKLVIISSRINCEYFRNAVDFEEWTNGTDYTLDGDCGGVTCKKNR